MMRLKHILLFVISLGFLMNVNSQEQLLELQIDAHLNNYHRTHQLLWKKAELNEPMFLPFFDNFNQESYRPDESLWIGDNIYVNKKYQLLPPDLGVATFDAMDGSGNIHSNASQFAFPADTLTSQAIRLDSLMDPTLRPMLVKDSVYFSFFYQPQGRGNAPEAADVLRLEFYSPSLDQWNSVWSSPGMTMEEFYQEKDTNFLHVLIAIKDSASYFHSGFQFRFHNLASMAGSSQPDWQSNADQWNIDFVRLDRNRSVYDTNYRKIAFVNQPPSMIKNYQAMPYRQYRNDPTNSMKSTIDSLIIVNLDSTDYTAVYKYDISNQTSQESEYDGGSVTIGSGAEYGYLDHPSFSKPPIVSFFSIYNETKKSYTVTHTVNDIGLTGIGDTAIWVQEFANYYAYDDGTAEAGYGMSLSNAKAALKFKLNTKDTLRQIQFYFNPTLTASNDQYFDLMVWKSIDPEEVIYTNRIKPEFTDGLYTFHTYDLGEDIILSNEFYIGFQQTTAENLNIGFDYAIDSKENLFYNIGTGWNQSIFEGSLMIRPVFGERMSTGITEVKVDETNFTMYPNPLNSSNLNFNLKEGDIQDYSLEIFSVTGQRILETTMQKTMNVSQLKNGIYLVRFNNTQTGSSETKKLIIRK